MSPKRSIRTNVLNPTDPIHEIIFFGNKMKANLLKNLRGVTLDGSTDLVTQVTFDIFDPGFRHMSTGIYQPKIPVRLDGYMFEISNIDTSEEDGHERLTVRCRPRAVRLLKKRTGKKVMKGVSPSEFVEAECKAVGLECVVQKSAKRKQVARDVKTPSQKGTTAKPSSWTTFQRLAEECGFILFEWGNTIYFGKPTWLLDRAKKNPFHIHWGEDAPNGSWIPFTVPACSKSEETKVVTVEANLPISAWKTIKVGGALKLSGMYGFNGTYLIDSVAYELAGGSTITVKASTPENPEKILPVRSGSGGGKGGKGGGGHDGPGGTEPPKGNGSVSAFVQNCLAQSGDKYIYGHEVDLRDPNPSAFDCSELIEWAAARAGVYMPDGSSAQITYCQSKGQGLSVSAAIGTYGAILWKPGHIAVSLGNGETIEAVGSGYGVRKMSATNRSFSWSAGGRVPGLRY